MKVALAQVDGKWPDLALAKLAAYHRRKGDSVTLFSPLEGAEMVYAGKVFTGTPDNLYLPPDTIRGGSGYDLARELPPHIENLKPDWSLWPAWTADLGYSTRGCVRNNNVTAAPIEHFRKFCADAAKAHVRLDFQQGLDARLLTHEHAGIIAHTPWVRRIHLAFDHVGDEEDVRRAINTFSSVGISPSRLTFYVLVGFDTSPDEDMDRVLLLRALGTDPFVMPYDRSNQYQRRFARWVNNHVAFKAMSWGQWLATFKDRGSL